MNLLKALPSWAASNTGIFTAMAARESNPFDDFINSYTAALLDSVYMQSRSGNKRASDRLLRMIRAPDTSEAAVLEQLAAEMSLIYAIPWVKLWQTLNFDYNPIANVESLETFRTITDHGKISTRALNTSHTYNNVTDEKQGSESRDSNITASDTEQKANTFASSAAVPIGESSTTGASNETTSFENRKDIRTGSESDSGTDTVTDSGQDVVTEIREREGNIGVTMTQRMIGAERELWLWNFYESIFADIDKYLISAIYEFKE